MERQPALSFIPGPLSVSVWLPVTFPTLLDRTQGQKGTRPVPSHADGLIPWVERTKGPWFKLLGFPAMCGPEARNK